MYDVKNVLGFVATFLVFVSYIPYFRDIFKGKTKPHPYTWLLWSFITSIAFGLQFTGGAGSASLVTLAAALMCICVFISTVFQKNKIQITKTDTAFLVFAILALGLWLIFKQPTLSAILITLVDVLAFIPTFRKSWSQPHTETVSYYFLESFRFTLAIIAIQNYSIVTTLYPVTWLLIEFMFAVTLLFRRKQQI